MIDLKNEFKDFPLLIEYLVVNNITKIEEFSYSDLLVFISRSQIKDKSQIIKKYLSLKESASYVSNKEKSLERTLVLNEEKKNNKIIRNKFEIENRWKGLDKRVLKISGIKVKLITAIKTLYEYLAVNYEVDIANLCLWFSSHLGIGELNIVSFRNFIENLFEFDFGSFKKGLGTYYKLFSPYFKNEGYKFIIEEHIANKLYQDLSTVFDKNVNILGLLSSKSRKYCIDNEIFKIKDLCNVNLKNIDYFDLLNVYYFTIGNIKAYDGYIEKYFIIKGKYDVLKVYLERCNGLTYKELGNRFNFSITQGRWICYECMKVFKEFFSSYLGLNFLNRLLSYQNGYIDKIDLKDVLPKYYSVIIKLVKDGVINSLVLENNNIYINEEESV